MTRSFPALVISFALLGLVAWMAAAHPGDGRLFTPRPHAGAPASQAPSPPQSSDR